MMRWRQACTGCEDGLARKGAGAVAAGAASPPSLSWWRPLLCAGLGGDLRRGGGRVAEGCGGGGILGVDSRRARFGGGPGTGDAACMSSREPRKRYGRSLCTYAVTGFREPQKRVSSTSDWNSRACACEVKHTRMRDLTWSRMISNKGRSKPKESRTVSTSRLERLRGVPTTTTMREGSLLRPNKQTTKEGKKTSTRGETGWGQ